MCMNEFGGVDFVQLFGCVFIVIGIMLFLLMEEMQKIIFFKILKWL